LTQQKKTDPFEKMLNEMIRDIDALSLLLDQAETMATIQTVKPYMYSFSITVNSEGEPVIQDSINTSPCNLGVREGGDNEPLTEVMLDEAENWVRVIAEMPGFAKEDIKIEAREDAVTLSAQHGDRKYSAEIPLKVRVDPTVAKATYVNGILEVRLRPRQPLKPEGVKVKVE
jgi:HSP20 family protein